MANKKRDTSLTDYIRTVSMPIPVGTLTGISISGLATHMRVPELDIAVDMGECPIGSLPINHVLLTHAHGDHTRCLMRHDNLRKMTGMGKDATYYMPEDIVGNALAMAKAEAMFEGVSPSKYVPPVFVPVKSGEPFRLPHRHDIVVEAFPVKHYVPAFGYTVSLEKKKLKDEFVGMSTQEIVKLKRQNVDITNTVRSPLITFMGDCIGSTLLMRPEAFKSRVLVTECTFVDWEDRDMALKKGHTHLSDIEYALTQLGDDVKCECIVLNHFSMKYSREHIVKAVRKAIPDRFKDIVRVFV